MDIEMKVQLKPELMIEEIIEKKMTIFDLYRYYYPGATIEQVSL